MGALLMAVYSNFLLKRGWVYFSRVGLTYFQEISVQSFFIPTLNFSSYKTSLCFFYTVIQTSVTFKRRMKLSLIINLVNSTSQPREALCIIILVLINILEFGLATQITALILWRVKMAISCSAAMSPT